MTNVVHPTYICSYIRYHCDGGTKCQYSLSMMSKQTSMAASAPMPSFSFWPSWTSSQFSPQKPSGHMHRYRILGSWFRHTPPFRHGLSKHSFLSTHPFRSGVMMRPSPQLRTIVIIADATITSNLHKLRANDEMTKRTVVYISYRHYLDLSSKCGKSQF